MKKVLVGGIKGDTEGCNLRGYFDKYGKIDWVVVTQAFNASTQAGRSL